MGFDFVSSGDDEKIPLNEKFINLLSKWGVITPGETSGSEIFNDGETNAPHYLKRFVEERGFQIPFTTSADNTSVFKITSKKCDITHLREQVEMKDLDSCIIITDVLFRDGEESYYNCVVSPLDSVYWMVYIGKEAIEFIEEANAQGFVTFYNVHSTLL